MMQNSEQHSRGASPSYRGSQEGNVAPDLKAARAERFEHNADDVHGGMNAAELINYGLRPDDVIDFSANVNPFGPSAAVLLAVRGAAINSYPDRHATDLRRIVAGRHGVDEEAVLVANGSSELIWLAALAYLTAGQRAAVLGPAFSGYARAARVMRADVISVDATPFDMQPPLDDFARALRESRPAVAFLANPGNPTGVVIEKQRIIELAAEFPDVLFVLDEAYADCVSFLTSTAARQMTPARSASEESPSLALRAGVSLRAQPSVRMANVLRLRSLTKAHALAGLRLGYATGDRAVIRSLKAVQPPWSVNAVAQAAGLAAFQDDAFIRATVAKWLDAKGDLCGQLIAAGFAPVPSATPFFLLFVKDAGLARSLLLRRGMVVRDCTSFGLPRHIRISARRPADNTRLLTALLEARAEILP